MTVFGKPAIPTPNALDLRVIQAGIAAARRRIEMLEEAVRALELAPSSTSNQLALMQAQIDSLVLADGTVTSVAATVPTFMSVGGTPITGTGTLAFTFNAQSRGEVFAGPVSGSDAAPNFRALQWYYDIPLFSSMSFTSGLDGTEIVPVERYGNMYWTTVSDIAALVAAPTFTWRDQSANYTLVAADMENGVSASGSAGTQVITIAAGLTGNAVLVYQAGDATVEVVAASGVNLRARAGLTAMLKGKYAVATVIRRSANEWFIAGDLGAPVNTSVAPATGTLTLTGLAPTLVGGTARGPGLGTLALTGLAPTVT